MSADTTREARIVAETHVGWLRRRGDVNTALYLEAELLPLLVSAPDAARLAEALEAASEYHKHADDWNLPAIRRIEMKERLGRALAALVSEPACEHEWASADNEAVSNAAICVKCRRIERADVVL